MKTSHYGLFLSLCKLEAEIRDEHRAHAPDHWWLSKLKKLRLAAKDRIQQIIGDDPERAVGRRRARQRPRASIAPAQMLCIEHRTAAERPVAEARGSD